jgi:mannose-6-phosphate isomerase-like protein (cupin superfamily)
MVLKYMKGRIVMGYRRGDYYDDTAGNMDYTRPMPRSSDYGPNPFVVNIRDAALKNNYFRTALWTGDHLQLTLMSIRPGEDIGLEIHPELDQILRIEQGQGVVFMGDDRDRLTYRQRVYDDYVILIPAGTWHNLVNTGRQPLKLYSIYAPPAHPFGTVHVTKRDAEEAHGY